jgi:exosortase
VANHKTALIAYGVISILLIALAYPALAWLVQSWLSNPYYTHGFLVPPIAALLAWRRWRDVLAEPRRTLPWQSVLGILVAVTTLVVILWAMRWQDYFVVSLALLALLGGILLYLEGWSRLRHWLFPLLFLAFMIPLPFVDRASPWLESFSAQSATALARSAGIAAFNEGGEITLPGIKLVVGAPCSGLRSLVTLITLGTGWVYLVEGRLAAKAAMLAAVIPLAALSNVLRIALLLVVATVWGEQSAIAYYHNYSSPILFLMAVGLLLILGKLLGCSRLRDDIF